MKRGILLFFKIVFLIFILLIWLWVYVQTLPDIVNISIIIGSLLLVFPIVWLGRVILDKKPTKIHVTWVTTFVHYALVILFGIPIIRAIITYQNWSGWIIPIPVEIGFFLFVITALISLLTMINLAFSGLGAPFAIALSKKLAVNGFYTWTRNPMVLAGLACLLSVGIWFQSVLFVIWTLFLVTPAYIFFLKIYEERELEIRFGASYLEYKSRMPMLFPKKPRC